MLDDNKSENLPCIDCITLSICKPIALKYYYMGNYNILLVTELEKRCELITDYIAGGEDLLEYNNRLGKIHKFYKKLYGFIDNDQ